MTDNVPKNSVEEELSEKKVLSKRKIFIISLGKENHLVVCLKDMVYEE